MPAAIAGVYDMTLPNVREPHALIGYSIVIDAMLSTCLVLHLRFKTLHWL